MGRRAWVKSPESRVQTDRLKIPESRVQTGLDGDSLRSLWVLTMFVSQTLVQSPDFSSRGIWVKAALGFEPW